MLNLKKSVLKYKNQDGNMEDIGAIVVTTPQRCEPLIVNYNITPYSDIKNAYDNKEDVWAMLTDETTITVVEFDKSVEKTVERNIIANLTSSIASTFTFTTVFENYKYELICDEANGWSCKKTLIDPNEYFTSKKNKPNGIVGLDDNGLIEDKLIPNSIPNKNYVDTLIEALEKVVSGKADKTHIHDDRYYTESEIDGKLSTINKSIGDITNGTTVVKKSERATNADSATSATKATQDSSGNVITETYETKNNANNKLTEAKKYTDNAVAQKSQVQIITWEADD